jgi:hypothetical protein
LREIRLYDEISVQIDHLRIAFGQQIGDQEPEVRRDCDPAPHLQVAEVEITRTQPRYLASLILERAGEPKAVAAS